MTRFIATYFAIAIVLAGCSSPRYWIEPPYPQRPDPVSGPARAAGTLDLASPELHILGVSGSQAYPDRSPAFALGLFKASDLNNAAQPLYAVRWLDSYTLRHTAQNEYRASFDFSDLPYGDYVLASYSGYERQAMSPPTVLHTLALSEVAPAQTDIALLVEGEVGTGRAHGRTLADGNTGGLGGSLNLLSRDGVDYLDWKLPITRENLGALNFELNGLENEKQQIRLYGYGDGTYTYVDGQPSLDTVFDPSADPEIELIRSAPRLVWPNYPAVTFDVTVNDNRLDLDLTLSGNTGWDYELLAIAESDDAGGPNKMAWIYLIPDQLQPGGRLPLAFQELSAGTYRVRLAMRDPLTGGVTELGSTQATVGAAEHVARMDDHGQDTGYWVQGHGAASLSVELPD